jgi:hypothetical protein
MQNPYLELTAEFNEGRLRALLSSGQAVVAHRLAVMSKVGDWILREDEEVTDHVLGVLERRGARYRFGAPLDCRWLAGGWSSHLEYRAGPLRIRTDFVSRPPRIPPATLARMWFDAERQGNPVVGLEPLAAIKLTNREKDYAVVGELARRMNDPRAQLLYSRSSRDLAELAARHSSLVAELAVERPLLARIGSGRDELEEALDRERRALMRANEERLLGYEQAAAAWGRSWISVADEVADLPLREAHARVLARADGVLPFRPAAMGGR